MLESLRNPEKKVTSTNTEKAAPGATLHGDFQIRKAPDFKKKIVAMFFVRKIA